MKPRLFKILMLLLAAVLLAGAQWSQRSLNRDREALGLARMAVLENAPPVLAFTTVALGGFRGIISNILWIRANDLQENDKHFEMVQLADWITKLEPNFASVWFFQAWNMTYNISVKFTSPEDRWRWVRRGIELLRDQALRYNPHETSIYRELSWFFQHKLGQNLDDHHQYYKRAWKEEMEAVLGKKVDWDGLLDPKTDEAVRRVRILKEQYKMDPRIMKETDEKYGPLEWRLPDAHAVYWAEVGRRRGREKDQNLLMRSIYQTLAMSFRRGAIYESKLDGSFSLGPALDNVANVSKAYEEMMTWDDEAMRDQPRRGHKNFLLDAVYFLQLYNRRTEAVRWYQYLNRTYPTAVRDHIKTVRGQEPPPGDIPLMDYVIFRVTEDVGETDVDRTRAVIGGLYQQSLIHLLEDEDDVAANFAAMAQQVWNRFQKKVEGIEQRVGLPPLEQIKQKVIDGLLAEQGGLPPEAAARLRARLGLPAAPPPGP